LAPRTLPVLFPFGALLAWAGALHWALHASGWLPDYRPVFHSIVQIRGFMSCLAVGFLFTVPRRTGTAPPRAWQMWVAIGAPITTTLAAWFDALVRAQVAWAEHGCGKYRSTVCCWCLRCRPHRVRPG
jgi:hypothetical protein